MMFKKRMNKAEVEEICQEAIAKLRKNKGCDITFSGLADNNLPWEDPMTVSSYDIAFKFHGEHFRCYCQSSIFEDDSPATKEEEGILIGTKDKRQMIILRVAKIIYEYYKGWLKNNGLANKIVDAPLTSTLDNVPVYTSTGPSVSKLHIGNKVVDLSDSYARTAISSVTDSVTDLRDALDQEKQKNQALQDRLDLIEAILKSKGLLDY